MRVVEGPRLELRSCDYQSQVLAGCTIPPYNGAFYLPTQAPSMSKSKFILYPTYLKGVLLLSINKPYLVNLYTVPSVRLILHPVT